MARGSPRGRRRWFVLVLAVLALTAALGGVGTACYLRPDLPSVDALEDYAPPLMTRVLAADGTAIGSFGDQRRIMIAYDEIPESFRNALIAVEDKDFFQHPGVDLTGIARALYRDVSSMRWEQGASTITQQLARNLFLESDKTVRRKAQEAMLAFEIERRYSKEEILHLYANQVYMGHGRYGVEAASRFYFDKSVTEVDLDEAALLAGIVQRPEGLSPFRHPDLAIRRRNFVLSRMADEEHITPAEAEAAQAEPLILSKKSQAEQLAPYFVEEVRRWLQTTYGDAALYKEGLEVRTSLDLRMQEAANQAVDHGLRMLDKRQGWRGAVDHVPEGEDRATWSPVAWKRGVEVGDVTLGVITGVRGGRATVRTGVFTGTLGRKEIAWTGRRDPASILKPGDLVHVRVTAGRPDLTADLELEQEPKVEAALVALDPRTGDVKALVGGFDFARSEFDRAMQARRQTGSAFKPFVYAAALARGYTLADTLADVPFTYLDSQTQAAYQPHNYKDEYHGRITLRKALEKSANVAAVRLLLQVGYDPVLTLARRLGIRADLKPYPSLALGAFEVSLLELTAAYGAFGNQGLRVEPHLVNEVRDRDGQVVPRKDPEVTEATTPEIAYLMTRLMEGVVTDGTGAAARSLGRPVAGKTGTTDQNTDAWFIGYSPDLVVGVWVGFDVKKSLGSRETGAQAALPIWTAFMREAIEDDEPRDFVRPPGVAEVTIDRQTGLKAELLAGCTDVFNEVFLAGTEPTIFCTPAAHQLLRLPEQFQRYAFNDAGELMVPASQLLELVSGTSGFRLEDIGDRMQIVSMDGTVSIPVTLVPDGEGTLPEPADRAPAHLGSGAAPV